MTIDSKHLTPAEKLLWSYGITEPAHIDLEAIALDHQATVQRRLLTGCEGRLVANRHKAVISVNSASSPGRQRFSLAHELAHWIHDRQVGSFLCASDDIGPQNAEAKSVESRANDFASQLIMPDYLVLPWINGKSVNLKTANELAQAFSTSLTAAAIKLAKRTRVPACITCHGRTTRHWKMTNNSFPPDIYIRKELHHDTDAFNLIFGGMSKMSLSKQEPADRWLTGSGIFKMIVETQSVLLQDDAVLTMIHLK